MKPLRVLTLVAAGLLLSGRLWADAVEPEDMADASLPQARIAMGWVDTMFNKCDPALAFKKYIDPVRYKNHPAAASGNELQMESEVVVRTCKDGVRFIFKKVLVRRDLVSMQIQVTRNSNPYGSVLSELMRVKGGKIVDHWDTHRDMKSGENAF
jgi:predicted SnoaL-like aldol condensation-catalyzing enzyme